MSFLEKCFNKKDQYKTVLNIHTFNSMRENLLTYKNIVEDLFSEDECYRKGRRKNRDFLIFDNNYSLIPLFLDHYDLLGKMNSNKEDLGDFLNDNKDSKLVLSAVDKRINSVTETLVILFFNSLSKKWEVYK